MMTNETEKISIKDYAKIKSVSVQSVYQRLKTTLKPYLIVENKQKWLSIEVLKADIDDNSIKGLKDDLKADIKGLKADIKAPLIEEEHKRQVERLEKEVEFLKEQLRISQEQTKRAEEERIAIEEERRRLFETNLSLGQRILSLEEKKPDIVEVATPQEQKKGFFRRLLKL